MKKFFYIPLIIFACCLLSCAKNTSSGFAPPENPGNMVKATIKTTGSPDILFNASGNNTIFSRSVLNGDTTIIIVGGDNERLVKLTLGNISIPGTYDFQADPLPGYRSFSFADYIIGNPNSPTALYTTAGGTSTGTVTVTTLSSAHISGSFTINFPAAGGSGAIQFGNASFTGDF